jgi:CotH kinase protein/Lamin Tail Domain/Chitobiase/beta-hexosaminidase C-terminal domain
MKQLFIAIAFCLLSGSMSAQLVINEYSAANLTLHQDAYESTEDWIELYNASSTATIALAGYGLSDDPDELSKWTFPANVFIGPNDHLTVWCSGRNMSDAIEHHTSFRLTQTKNTPEVITLTNQAGAIVDQVEVRKTKKNMSRGRISDGNANWGIFTNPTINAANTGSSYRAFADRPSFSATPGFYASTLNVTITNNDDPLTSVIRYTLDGTEPTATSTLYTDPIAINETRVLKAAAFSTEPDMLNSFIEFSTFFIGDPHTVVVVSIAANELQTLANGDQGLRPEGTIEYFNVQGERVARSYGDFNSHGQDSWVNDQRSLDLICRDEMGYTRALSEKIFQRSDRDEFQRLILRAGGDDNYPGTLPVHEGCAHMRDAYIHNLADRGGLNLDLRRSEKAVVYINGDYWGVYDLRELPDDNDFTEYYYNQGKYDIQYLLTWGDTWAEYGGDDALQDWLDLRQYINSNSMVNQSNFDYVASQLDVESLVDYVIVNSVTVCSDWLNYNTGWWRGLHPDGGHKKWGYILWDNDATFAYYIDYTGIGDTSATAPPCQVENLTSQWPDLNGHMRTLKKLRTNPEFDRYYKSRYIDLMNNVFSCDNMLSYLDSVEQIIAPEMPRHIARWGGTYEHWQSNVERLRDFIRRRCVALNQGVADCYNLTGPYPVTFDVNPDNIGAVMQVNSLNISEFPYTGNYFGNIDIRVQAGHNTDLAPNMEFKRWLYNTSTFTQSDTLDLSKVRVTGVDTIVARFALVTSSTGPLPEGVEGVVLTAAPTLFSSNITATLDLPASGPVALRITDLNGRVITNLATPQVPLASGRHTFDVEISAGRLAPGMYLLHLETAGQVQTVKLVYAPE